MAVHIGGAADVAAGEVTVAAYSEIDTSHIVSLGGHILKTAGRRAIFLSEERLDITFQVGREIFSGIAPESRCDMLFVAHGVHSLSAQKSLLFETKYYI